MEENLMEKLLNNFNGTLDEFNELVRKNDYDGVVKVLAEVNRLLQERNGIVLDDREPQYDHVLHELLDKMKGIVEKEITVQGIDGVQGTRYYTNEQVRKMIEEIENELKNEYKIERNEEGKYSDEEIASSRGRRQALLTRKSVLEASIVEGQELSTLTFVDPHLAELQAERARLLQEKQENLREIERLRAEERPETPDIVTEERITEE